MSLLLLACASPPLKVVTFNGGTTLSLGHEHAELSDAAYGNGLAWWPAIEVAQDWFAELQPDVVAMQEVFHTDDCVDEHEEFVCSSWTEGSVLELVLGSDYTVVCHPGKNDKCIAARESFTVVGASIEGCGDGARVGRAELEGLTVVTVHGSSGLTTDDQ